MEFVKSELSQLDENKRKRKVTFDPVREEKLMKPNPKFHSFKNVFLMENNTPFFESSRVLPIIRNVSVNNNNPNCRYYQRVVQYMPSNAIFYEKYNMDDEIVFSITMGTEELIIPRVRKSKDKIRNVYVNGIKRIESKYNKDGIEYELNCFDETGKKLLFHRKMESNSFKSYQYDLNGNILKKWIE
jgi:hypothetical protein